MWNRIFAASGLVFSFSVAQLCATSKLSPADEKAADYSKEPFVIELSSDTVAFEKDGTSTSEIFVRARIQAQAGLQQYGLLHFLYPSANSTIDLVSARVIKPDHRVVETPSESILDMPAEITRLAPFYSDLKEKQVAVKGLEIGDTVEYRFRMRAHSPVVPGQFWFGYNFFKGGIVLGEELKISIPRDQYVQIQSPHLQPAIVQEGSARIYTWKSANLERKPESKDSKAGEQPEPSSPDVQLTTFHSWDEVGQWFRSLAAPRAAPTPEIRAKAEKLIEGATNDAQKIQALYNFVSTKYRYIGIALVVGRYQPHAAAEVLSNDYGDCKDKHTLLAALLAAVGIKAFPALINSTAKIDPEVPSPGQFDHVITVVPQEKGLLWLDSTPEVAPVGYLLANLRDKQALVIADTGPAQLIQTPADPPFRSFFHFQAEGSLDDAGVYEGKMKISTRGDAEVLLRAALRRVGQPQWKDVLQSLSFLLGFGGTVSDVTTSPLEETESPLQISYHYSRKDYGDWADKEISPPFPPSLLAEVPSDSEKSAKPLDLGTPEDRLYEASVKLPKELNPELPGGLELKQDFGEYRSTYSFSENVLHAERHLITKAHQVLPGQFEAYRKFRKAISDEQDSFISLKEAGSETASTGTPEARALVEQGGQAWQRRNLPEALDLFERAVKSDPNYAPGWMGRGWAHIFLGDMDKGIEDMRKGVALDPKETFAYKNVASALQGMKRREDALAVWRELEKLKPDDRDAPRNIGLILFELKRYSEAVPELETAVDRNPSEAALLVQLGVSYIHSGQSQKGVDAFQRAIEVDSSGAILNDVAYEMVESNLHLGEALDYAEKAVKERENHMASTSLENLSFDDIRNVDHLGAEWDTLGWVHFRMGHLDAAERYLNAGWKLSEDPVIGDHLAQVFEKEGKKREAAQAYARAIAAGNAPEQTQKRLNALSGSELRADEMVASARPELGHLRTVKLGKLAAERATAEFFVLFGPGPKVEGVKFISGSDALREAGKVLASAKYDVIFPDEAPTKLLRRGILACEPLSSGCEFVLMPPGSVNSVK